MEILKVVTQIVWIGVGITLIGGMVYQMYITRRSFKIMFRKDEEAE